MLSNNERVQFGSVDTFTSSKLLDLPAGLIITESGDPMVSESGDFLIVE